MNPELIQKILFVANTTFCLHPHMIIYLLRSLLFLHSLQCLKQCQKHEFPRKHVQVWLCSLTRAQPRTQARRERKWAAGTERLNLSGSHMSLLPLTHLWDDQAAALTSAPEKIFRKIFRIAWPGCLKTHPASFERTEPRPTNRRWMVSSSLQRGDQLCQVTAMWASKCLLQSSATEKLCDYSQGLGVVRGIGVIFK